MRHTNVVASEDSEPTPPPETQEPVLLVSAQSLHQPVVASHPKIPADSMAEAMRLNADDFVPLRHKTVVIEIGGVHERRRSNRADPRSRLTFWPLLQQSQK